VKIIRLGNGNRKEVARYDDVSVFTAKAFAQKFARAEAKEFGGYTTTNVMVSGGLYTYQVFVWAGGNGVFRRVAVYLLEFPQEESDGKD
jgi:hypothetical protein